MAHWTILSRTPAPPTSLCKPMRWALRGHKSPSFRAVLLMPTKPQRLPGRPNSVSDRLLSLFTRTYAGKVRSKNIGFTVFCGSNSAKLFGAISVGAFRAELEVRMPQRSWDVCERLRLGRFRNGYFKTETAK